MIKFNKYIIFIKRTQRRPFCIHFFFNANNNGVLIIVVIIYSIIIFPISINIRLYYSNRYRKIYFLIELFRFIKIFSGYIEVNKEEIIVHISSSRAIIIKFIQLFNFRKKFKPLKDYHVIEVNSLIELGSSEHSLRLGIICLILNYLDNFIGWYFYHDKPYLKLNNKINYYNNDKTNLYFSFKIVFNILMVIISVFKIIGEKLLYALSNRKQQN